MVKIAVMGYTDANPVIVKPGVHKAIPGQVAQEEREFLIQDDRQLWPDLVAMPVGGVALCVGADLREVDDGAEGSANQALDFGAAGVGVAGLAFRTIRLLSFLVNCTSMIKKKAFPIIIIPKDHSKVK